MAVDGGREPIPVSAERRVAAGVAAFGQALVRLGAPVTTLQLEAAARALTVVDPTARDQVYWALNCTLIGAREQQPAFDRVFEAFWSGSALFAPQEVAGDAPPDPSSAAATSSETGAGEGGLEVGAEGARTEEAGGEGDEPGEAIGVTFSPHERLRHLDFEDLDEADMQQVERLIRRLGRFVPLRQSRRLRAADRGRRLDLRKTLRRSTRTEGHPLELAWRRRQPAPRPLVFLIDVSGSMESYARPMLAFAWGARRSSRRVEAFAFGTRLTRLTAALDASRYRASLEAVADCVPDWAGGTRIGESLRAFTRGWGRRGMGRGAAVVIVSDGWERGKTVQLARAMRTIKRLAHTVIWVNPLAADQGYEPIAAGMATALPYVDHFLPGHSIEDLRVLAEILAALPPRRQGRKPARKSNRPRNPSGRYNVLP